MNDEDRKRAHQLLEFRNPPPHDYEPGDTTHPMHTDPLCRVCGATKKSHDD